MLIPEGMVQVPVAGIQPGAGAGLDLVRVGVRDNEGVLVGVMLGVLEGVLEGDKARPLVGEGVCEGDLEGGRGGGGQGCVEVADMTKSLM